MSTDRQLEVRAMVAVLFAAVLAYATSLTGVFVYDDIHSIEANSAIRSMGNVPAYFVDVDMFSATKNLMYRPVLLTTYALNHAVAGVAPLVYKATNLGLHALASLLLFLVARRLGAARIGAAIAAVLFAVHPLNSETVNLVSARSELLMVVGLLIGIRCHVAAAAGSRSAMLGTAVAAVIACGSKETGVVLPGVLLVLEGLWRVRGERIDPLRSVVLRLLPAAAVSGVYLIVRKLLLGHAAVDLAALGGGHDLLSGHGRDWVTQLATMCVLLPRILLQVLVPVGLSLDPPVTYHRSFADLSVLSGATALALLTWLGCRAPRRRPGVLFGTVLAWMTSLPWIIVPLNVPLSEHRLYGLLAGLALILATSLRPAVRPVAVLRLPAALAGAALLALPFAAVAAWRSLDYRAEHVLWEKVLARDPYNFRARWGLAMNQVRRGLREDGRRNMYIAHAIYPDHVSARVSLVEAVLSSPLEDQRPFLALCLSDALIERDAANPYYRILRSEAMIQAGRLTGEQQWFATAEELALSCLEVATPKGLVYRTAADARHAAGDLEGAIGLLDQSVARGLDHFSVLVDRAGLLREAGRDAEAEADLRRAMQQDPLDPMVRAAVDRFFGAPPGR